MDISDGEILLSTPSDILTKGKYYIHVFRTRQTCLVSVDLWNKKYYVISWSTFTEELIAHNGDTKTNTFFSQLINIKQKGSIIEHIQ